MNKNDEPESRGRGPLILAALASLGILVALYLNTGLYSLPPLGALPEGKTVLVWRAEGEPFFNSPDALCHERLGYVSLFCRGAALMQAPTDRIILRLPYQEWAFNLSVPG